MIEWWSAHDGSLYGAIGGSIVGVVGGCLGAAVGVLAPRGKGRRIVMSAVLVVLAVGVVALIAGLAALMTKQPYHVWYPLTLGGALTTSVLGALAPMVNMRYRHAEARRMDAEQLRRS